MIDIDTNKLIKFLDGEIEWIKTPKPKHRIKSGRLAMFTKIRRALKESDIAHWMDRCHRLEIELAEYKKNDKRMER